MKPYFTSYIKNQDISEIISLDKIKRGLNITHDVDDLLLSELLLVSLELAEKYIKRLIGESTVTIVCDQNESSFFLPFGDATDIESFKIDDSDSEDYTFNTTSQKITINVAYNTVEIVYKCGMTTLPPSVERAIIFMISTLYNSGGDFTTNAVVSTLPITSTHLLESHRYYAC